MQQIEIKIEKTAQYLLSKTRLRPKIGFILGTGLTELFSTLEIDCKIPYSKIPYFPQTTVKYHVGNLTFGSLRGKEVVVMQGRFHCYEGYSPKQVAFPVWVMKKVGVKYLVIVNAAGGLNPDFSVGDIMVITDHINLMGLNPLTGPNIESMGIRFPDMSQPYSLELIKKALEVFDEEKLKLKKGVYVGVLGPSLETAAEIRFLRMIGGDAVGMSTIPEVIAAVHCGIWVLGLSVISNLNIPEDLKPFSIEEVVKNVEKVKSQLGKVIEKVVERL